MKIAMATAEKARLRRLSTSSSFSFLGKNRLYMSLIIAILLNGCEPESFTRTQNGYRHLNVSEDCTASPSRSTRQIITSGT
ncbi:hypothetical protein DPMN_050335 [Dreissena polymorpha]|uniref:Uncharacterized protein n=1 Tax=Dreissena polymorpha TaxID=45954 RepID=A0A9D4CH07_DREPO|nr:hypothetical protein DPMN_050335 [Dreissena polymorpha]